MIGKDKNTLCLQGCILQSALSNSENKADFTKKYINFDFIQGMSTWFWVGDISGIWAVGFTNGNVVITKIDSDNGAPWTSSIKSILK